VTLQTDDQILIGLKCDLALLTVMAKGNDYVPPLRGVVLESGGRSTLLMTHALASHRACKNHAMMG